MNGIPIDKQQLLHDINQLIKENIKYIQSEPRFGFGYDKNIKDIFTYDSDKIIQNTVGLKRWVKTMRLILMGMRVKNSFYDYLFFENNDSFIYIR